MENINYPINFTFNISTFSNDFTATDAQGNTIAYVRQKMFKLKEAISVFSNESKTQINYKIDADRWIDFSAAYSIKNISNAEIGKIARKGWKSIWKAEYEIINSQQTLKYRIKEDNAWIKVLDNLMGEIPVLNFFTGYFFNPSYSVIDLQNKAILQMKKEASFFGRKFQITKLTPTPIEDEETIILSLMMMVLLERRKG